MQSPKAGEPQKSVCAICHEQGGGCCRLGADGTERMFGLTLGEVEMIAKASNKEPGSFVTADVVASEFLNDLAAIHPVFSQTMPGGRRLRLAVTQDDACIFLGPTGCSLPIEARPLYCRLFPFWFTPGGQLMVLISSECLAQKNARSGREVLANMGETKKHLRGLFTRLEELAYEHQKRDQKERPGA